jgi:Na+-translocating ferredoxin:NAD+ oxidoreductase RnfD subunit
MEKINMEKKLLVSASPHIRDHISTRRIMLDVVIALAPAALLGIYYHGLRAALLIAVCIVSCVLFEKLTFSPWLRSRMVCSVNNSFISKSAAEAMLDTSKTPITIKIIRNLFFISL